jgi:hypothetical protein
VNAFKTIDRLHSKEAEIDLCDKAPQAWRSGPDCFSDRIVGPGMLEVIAGAIIAILIATGVEYLRRPNLSLEIENPPQDVAYHPGRPATHARYLRLRLINNSLPLWARWMIRAPALQCRGTVTFHHLDGQNVFG